MLVPTRDALKNMSSVDDSFWTSRHHLPHFLRSVTSHTHKYEHLHQCKYKPTLNVLVFDSFITAYCQRNEVFCVFFTKVALLKRSNVTEVAIKKAFLALLPDCCYSNAHMDKSILADRKGRLSVTFSNVGTVEMLSVRMASVWQVRKLCSEPYSTHEPVFIVIHPI